MEDRMDLIDIYLDLLHGKPHTLFHPDRLRQSVSQSPATSHIVLAIAGLACRFSQSATIRARKALFMEAVRDALKQRIDDFSLDTLRACILVGNLYGAEGHSNVESVFFAIAFRIAHIIKLPHSNSEDDSIAREEKIRSWWSLYMVDRWSSAGLDVPRQMPDDQHVPLPLHEREFYGMRGACDGSHRSQHEPGLWAQMIQLARYFGCIQDLHKKYADGDVNVHEMETMTGHLSHDLCSFIDKLPVHLRLNNANLRRHASHNLGRDLVALHLGYHHYATLLHFPYLDKQLEANERQLQYARRCKESAAALSDLLSQSRTIDKCKPVYFIVAHMIAVSSSAMLHDLLFGDECMLDDTRHRLKANFEALVELKTFWPAAEMMVSVAEDNEIVY